VGLFASLGIGIILVFILMVLIGGLFMWIAAKIARVERASFPRAMVAAIATSFVGILLWFLFNLIPILGSLFGFILGLIVSILVIKAVFGTSFGKALIVWICNLIAAGLALLVASMILASSIFLSHGI